MSRRTSRRVCVRVISKTDTSELCGSEVGGTGDGTGGGTGDGTGGGTGDGTGDHVNDILMESIMTDMQSSLEESEISTTRRNEEMRLRNSTDPSEHLCGPLCPYLKAVSSHRETVDYVCPISHQAWGGDKKWDAVIAGLCTTSDDNGNSRHYKPQRRTTASHEKDVLPVYETDLVPMDPAPRATREPISRAAPKSTREVNPVETLLSLRSMATQSISQRLNTIELQQQSCNQIQNELVNLHSNENSHNRRPFTLTQLHNVCLEAQRRWTHLEQRACLYKHVLQQSTLVEQFVHTLAQLFATLWILITQNQICRRELDSFRAFVHGLLNCLHRGMRILNQPIIPQGILFFHDVKRKHRGDSAHHALQRVQGAIATIPTGVQRGHFQQCIRLSKQLEDIHETMLNSDPQSTPEAKPKPLPSRDKEGLRSRSGAPSGPSPNP